MQASLFFHIVCRSNDDFQLVLRIQGFLRATMTSDHPNLRSSLGPPECSYQIWRKPQNMMLPATDHHKDKDVFVDQSIFNIDFIMLF